MFQSFTFYGRQVLDAQGSTFVYSDSDSAINGADERITVFADGAQIGTLRPGAVLKMPRTATRWEITPVSDSQTLSGTVHIGTGDYFPGTVNGTVTVVDGELARSIQGYQAVACTRRYAAAGLYPVLALCHYATDFHMAVRSLKIASSASQDLTVWIAQHSAEPVHSLRQQFRNKMLSLAASTFVTGNLAMYALNDSTVAGATSPDSAPVQLSGWQLAGYFRSANGAATELIDRAPIVIPSGYTLAIVGQTAASSLFAEAEIEALLV